MSVSPSVAPILILGMHRSGTSLLARMLAEAGVYLGPPEQLVQAHKEDNPDGYWENTKIIDLNDRLLKALGGMDQRPPAIKSGWSEDPAICAFTEEADAILSQLVSTGPWGWKDPRTMLTLEFWVRLLPSARLVFVVRNPIEVALSLGRRSNYDWDVYYSPCMPQAFVMWAAYHQAALAASGTRELLVVHYGKLVSQPKQEFMRVLQKLGLPDVDVASAAKPELRRNRIPDEMVNEKFVPAAVAQMYSFLCSAAGAPIVAEADELLMLDTYRELMPQVSDQLAALYADRDKYYDERKLAWAECDRLGREIQELMRIREEEVSALRQELEKVMNSRTLRIARGVGKVFGKR